MLGVWKAERSLFGYPKHHCQLSEGKLGKLGKFMMRRMGSKALTTLCLRPSRWVVKPS